MYSNESELRAIDGLIDEYQRAGIDLSGVNFDNPVVMGSVFKKIFKKIGKGVKNLAQKIKQRIKERGVSTSVETDQARFSIGPEGVKAQTPSTNYESGPGGTRISYESQSDKGIPMPIEEKPAFPIPPMYIVGGIAAIILLMVVNKGN